ncbi:MAG: DUF2383 domain-containing protein [Chitinivibrionales bacterium]|nr:DUF2383 domain-containing protein [Chitinivibrionales bacterium]
MESEKQITEHLVSLIKIDIDASHGYSQAIDEVEDPDIQEQLIRYQEDHERHIDDLSALLLDMGEEPPELTRDIKGYFIEGMTALRSRMGTEQALKAMEQNEKLTNKTYGDARKWDVPQEVHEVIQRNFTDEQEHLKYIQETLKKRTWEQKTHV